MVLRWYRFHQISDRARSDGIQLVAFLLGNRQDHDRVSAAHRRDPDATSAGHVEIADHEIRMAFLNRMASSATPHETNRRAQCS